jgi:hypothetical protein
MRVASLALVLTVSVLSTALGPSAVATDHCFSVSREVGGCVVDAPSDGGCGGGKTGFEGTLPGTPASVALASSCSDAGGTREETSGAEFAIGGNVDASGRKIFVRTTAPDEPPACTSAFDARVHGRGGAFAVPVPCEAYPPDPGYGHLLP